MSFKNVLRKLLSERWRAWVADEPGTMLLAKAHAFIGDYETARAAYKQLALFTPDRQWRAVAQLELAALAGPARALAVADAITVPPAGAAVRIDGRLDEPFWKRARTVRLELAGPARPKPRVRRGSRSTPLGAK